MYRFRAAMKFGAPVAIAVAALLLVHPLDVMAQEQNGAAVQKLIQQLQNPDETIRLRAAKELGKLGPVAQSAIPALQNALNDTDEDVRRVAANSLKAIQVAGPSQQIQRLIRDLQSPDEIVRLKAAKDLGKLGAAARSAVPELQKLMQDPDEDVRRVAQNSIRLIQGSTTTTGPSPAVQKLIQNLGSTDELVRLKAAKELAKMGSAAKDAIPALQKLLQDPDEDVRRVASTAIERIQGGGGPPPSTTTTVAGTTWSGSESLAGFSNLTFQFDPDGKAIMIDAKSRVNGKWSQNGNEVIVSFGNCVYTGTIQGQVMSGSARYTSGSDTNWTFSLTLAENPAPSPAPVRGPTVSALGSKPWPDHKFPPAIRIMPRR